ncbi:MAG: O-Antigen ligase [Acidobacteria bacterium]|nr:O-Antigen ligase [Acidobacteriota bacterium]
MVKYLVFSTMLVGGVPLMAFAAMSSARLRGLLLSLLVFSTVLGDVASINFLSTETYRGPDRGFELTLTDLVALALALAVVARFPRRIRWLPLGTWPMALLFVLAIVSTVNAQAPLLGTFTLFKLVRIYLLFWCVVNVVGTGVSLDYVRYGLVAMGLVMTVLALKQKYVYGMYRITGPFDHSNGIPLYCNLVIPVLLVWGMTDRRLSSAEAALTVFASLGMVFAVVATQSRAGTLLTGLSVALTLVVANARARSPRVSWTTVTLVLIMLAGGALVADTIVQRFREAPESSEQARDEFNVAARRMAGDRAFGVGLNNFSLVLTTVDRYNEHIEVMKGEEQGGVAHHIYWLTAAEMGYVGLFAFLIVLGGFLWRALLGAIRATGLESLLLWGFFIGFVALYLQGTLEWGLRITPMAFQLTICGALTVALSANPRARRLAT